ncbi:MULTISPECIES: ABC transporter substrate-binding protein [unclassified Streptomyces]|uniref:ABC transporter substrate-binding protein n=1 Tax=unclassified Streptomyces TaxID=2593676 RepID=UPI00225639AB|nr:MULTISPECIES: extracellular solute-binding protein [unclassified Streptomyces]MCX4878220.1 extracellular solute-binding protein [Streptomyces sp. NBC_00847]MCX5418223.1 extracellular solute-binding protein [Streptomyces sp. NBC_00078]
MTVNKPSSSPKRALSKKRAALLAGCAATVLLTVTACGGGSTAGTTKDGFAQAPQKDGALTVWVDATRMDAAKLYQQQHPDVKLNIVSYDGDANGSNYLQTKVQLFNRTGKGWPDVVFSSQNNEASWAVDAGFAAPLNKGLIPSASLGKFAKGANDVCTVGGTLYCLRNDLSQAVLWYNAPLLKKFGYSVPTTWEEFQQLGEKVAKEHPGYLVGDAGDSFTPEIYLWASKCGANHITGPKAVSVNTSSEACTKMAKLLDVLIKNKSMSISGVFSTDFGKNKADKVLLMPGPAWYGGALFEGTFKTPAKQIAAAPIPQWQGDNAPSTGNVGGGTWLLSKHSEHVKAATDFLKWVTTDNAYQGKKAPGFPAYAPASEAWLKGQAASGYFAGDLSALSAAASQVWPEWGSGQFSQEAIWAATVKPGITQGKSIASMLPAWQDSIVKYAKSNGYKVAQ